MIDGFSIRKGISSPSTVAFSCASACATCSSSSFVSWPRYPSQAKRQSSRIDELPFTAAPIVCVCSSVVRSANSA